jgi:hypothetical protein
MSNAGDDYADLLAVGVPLELCQPLRAGMLVQTCGACGAASAATWSCYKCHVATGPTCWYKPPVSTRRMEVLEQARAIQASRRMGLSKSPTAGQP